jgi:hypothetical protein
MARSRRGRFTKRLAAVFQCSEAEAERRWRTILTLAMRECAETGSIRLGRLGMLKLRIFNPRPRPKHPGLVQPLPQMRLRLSRQSRKLLALMVMEHETSTTMSSAPRIRSTAH